MDKYDMTSLFCNLLDNAVEAATGVSDFISCHQIAHIS